MSHLLDDSFDFVHPAVLGEIEDAVGRAIQSGAYPPIGYVGAGAFGIVLRDARGVAYKVSRHGSHGIAAGSLREEAEWFRFAQTIPSIRQHVAQVYQFDTETGVLIREYVESTERRMSEGKRDVRRHKLYERITKAMREYGFRGPEYKEDSFVYHPRRGPVLIDAGLGSRDIGWAGARRAQQLLSGATPQTEYEVSAIVHGLRMDAGIELPYVLANRLADALEREIDR